MRNLSFMIMVWLSFSQSRSDSAYFAHFIYSWFRSLSSICLFGCSGIQKCRIICVHQNNITSNNPKNDVVKLVHCSRWCHHRFKQSQNDISTRFKQSHLSLTCPLPCALCNTTHSQKRVKQLCLCIASHSKALLTHQQFCCLSLHNARNFGRVVDGFFDPIWNFDSALF